VTAFHFSFPKVTGSVWRKTNPLCVGRRDVRKANVVFVGGAPVTIVLALVILCVEVIWYCMHFQKCVWKSSLLPVN